MTILAHKALVQRFVAAVNAQAWDDLDHIVAADVVYHGVMIVTSLAALTQGFMTLRAGVPDLQETIEDLVAEGDRVAYRVTLRGTHLGELLGIPATGRTIAVAGIVIDRIADGKIVEEWNQSDLLGLMRTLGAIPAS